MKQTHRPRVLYNKIYRYPVIGVLLDIKTIDQTDESPARITKETSANKHNTWIPIKYNNLPRKLCVIWCILSIILMIPTLSATVIYNITKFTYQPGIYFEKIGNNITIDEWNIISYVNLTNYWLEYRGYEKGILQLTEAAKLISKDNLLSRNILPAFQQHLEEII